MKKVVTSLIGLILLCGMLSGCVYTPPAYPIVQDKGLKSDNTSAVQFSTFMQVFGYDPYGPGKYPYEEFGPVTFESNFSYGDCLYYVESYMDLGKQGKYYVENWKYTVYKADGEYVGTLISDIDKRATSQHISISFLDEQYIYYMCRNRYVEERFAPSPEGFIGRFPYTSFAFFRFNLETCENEEISLALLFEKLVPIHKEYLLERERPGYPVYEIKINPEYKGKK